MSPPSKQSASFSEPLAVIEKARHSIFQILLATASVSLVLLCFRWLWLYGSLPLSDVYCALLCILAFFLVHRRPSLLNSLAWVSFFALLVDACDGLPVYKNELFPEPTLLLLPSLVLYGALLGHGSITFAGLLSVLTIYTFTAIQEWPLSPDKLLSLSNLTLLSLSLGIASLLIWQRHLKIYHTLHQQADELRSELDVNRRLISLVSHDIANPLTVITGYTEPNARSQISPADLEIVNNMARRISEIIDSVRRLQTPTDSTSTVQTITLREIYQNLSELFQQKLHEKNQRLLLEGDEEISVRADAQILCHSILGNFITNASKYAPRHTDIELVAIPLAGERVSIEIHDRGPGIDPAVIDRIASSGRITPTPGTEGEKGSGAGLRIAALCASRLGAEITFNPRVGGGNVAAVILPRGHNTAGSLLVGADRLSQQK